MAHVPTRRKVRVVVNDAAKCKSLKYCFNKTFLMEISPGARMGRYEIRSKIGAGGMGEVYLAQDTQLDRPVALKFLPADVASHQKRMQRFIQEAKAASALNHPNILTVYEIGEEGAHFFATEFVDGVTLRQRMKGARMKLS